MERNELYPVFLKLHQLNVLIAEQRNCTVDDLAGFVSGGRTSDTKPAQPKVEAPSVETLQASTNEVLTDKDIAKNYRSQADAMYKEAFRNFGENDVDLRQGYGGLLMGEAYATMKDEKSTAAKRKEAIAVLEKCLPYVKGSVNEASAYYIMSDLYLQSKDFQMADQCIDKSILIYDKKSYRDQKEKIGKQKTSK